MSSSLEDRDEVAAAKRANRRSMGLDFAMLACARLRGAP
jgi:hypothetical protein